MFNKRVAPENDLQKLYKSLSFIGFRVNHSANINMFYDVEKTIISSLYYIDQDGRLISLIFSWLSVHHNQLNTRKLLKEYHKASVSKGETPWFVAVCVFLRECGDGRLVKEIKPLPKKHYFQNRNQDSLIEVKGSVNYLEEVNIYISQSSLNINDKKVLLRDELINHNFQYKNRVLFGNNFMAEILTWIKSKLN